MKLPLFAHPGSAPRLKWAAVPSVIALFLSNAVLLEQHPALLSLSVFGFIVGTLLFGLAWVMVGEAATPTERQPSRAQARTLEVLRVGLASAWIYVAFSMMLNHTPAELRLVGLAAAYAIATAWWAMKLMGEDEQASHAFALPVMVAAGFVAVILANFSLPIELLMPIVIAMIAGRSVLRLSPR